MSIIVELVPDNRKLLEGDSEPLPPRADLAGTLQSAYLQRFEYYERQLAGVLNLVDVVSPELTPSHFPTVSVVFDGEEEEIVFDFSLYESLLEIYVFEGWLGIMQIEQVLNKRLSRADEEAQSGGVRVNAGTIWLPVKTFFYFTRNLLALLIRDALVGIERKAATSIFARLNQSAILIAKAWKNEFEIERITRLEESALSPSGSREKIYYHFKNRPRSKTMFDTLSEAVKQKFALEEALKKLWLYSQAKGTDFPVPPHESLSPEELEKSVDASKKLYESILGVIHNSSPLGLIVLDGLKIDFTQEDMEQKLGAALWELYKMVDEIGSGIDSSVSRVSAEIPTLVTGEQVAWDTIQRWNPPPNGIEGFVSSAAVERLTGDPGWFPLAHEATWHRLVESGVIAKDSLEYVVYFHYISALIDRVEKKQNADEAYQKFSNIFSRIAAGLSLTSLFFPILLVVSGVADLAAMAISIYSVTGNLAKLSQSLSEELIHPDSFALENLARIGELSQIRRETLDNFTGQIAFELALGRVGAKWARVKKLTLGRGYYFDLETLLDDGEEED